MKSTRWLSAIMLPSLIVSTPLVFGDPGSEPYTPTKLEWLVMELNAQYRQGELFDFNWEISYRAIPPDTVEVLPRGKDAIHRTNLLDTAVSNVKELAESKGWDWVIVKTAEVEQSPLATMSDDEIVKYILELREEKERLSKPIDQSKADEAEFRRIESVYKQAKDEESVAAVADEYHKAYAARQEYVHQLQDRTLKLYYAEEEYARRFPPTTTPGQSNNNNQAQDAISGILPGIIPPTAQEIPKTTDE